MKQAIKHIEWSGLLNRILYQLIVWVIFLASILINSAFGQALVYLHHYSGDIQIDQKKSKVNKIVQVDTNHNYSIVDDKYDGKWNSKSKAFQPSNDKLEFSIWRNAKYGEEIETYTIRIINEDTLLLEWMRNCTVFSLNKKIPGQSWTIHGSGYLIKEKESSEAVTVAKANGIDRP